MTPSPVSPLILIAAVPSVGLELLKVPREKFSVCEKFSVWRGLDGDWLPWIIPAARSGTPALPLFKHPARSYALVSLPRAGLVSPAMTRRSPTDEH